MQNMINKPSLTPKMQAEIQALQSREIDLSEDKEITDWTGAVRGKFKFNKHHTTQKEMAIEIISHLDDEVLQLLIQHNTEQDYKRINGVLKAMLATG